jgi:hypothetical protein
LFGHYFHLLLAPLALLAAPGFCTLLGRGLRYRVPLALSCLLPAAFFLFLATAGRPLAAALGDDSWPEWDRCEGHGSRVARHHASTHTGPW